MVLARSSYSPSGFMSSDMGFQSTPLVTSADGYSSKNRHSTGMATLPVGRPQMIYVQHPEDWICFRWILPLVLFRKMVATRSFQGSWKRVSCTRLKGDRGGVHFLKAFLLGGLRPEGTHTFVQNHKHSRFISKIMMGRISLQERIFLVKKKKERKNFTIFEWFSAEIRTFSSFVFHTLGLYEQTANIYAQN